MTRSPHAAARRQLVRSPTSIAGYQAIFLTDEKRDPDTAIRAAWRACLVGPQHRLLWSNLQILLQRAGRRHELQSAIPRTPRPLPPRQRHPVDLDAAVSRYGWLMAELSRRSGEGWTPSRIEDSKRRYPLTREHLANFRRSEVSGGTQTFPDRPKDFTTLDFDRRYPDYTAAEHVDFPPMLHRQWLGLLGRLYRNGAPGVDWYEAAAADDDRFGARTLDVPGLGIATAKSLQSAYYACRIMALVPRNGVVLEIGGGFGALASRLLAIRPDVTYVLTDLPINMVLTHSYLASFHGDGVAGLWDDGDRPDPRHRALIVPPWRLAALPFRVDLAVNTMSFQHMDERNHAFYGNAMRALGTRRLYHLNRNVHMAGNATMDVPAERYGFMAGYAITYARDFDVKWIEVIADARS